MLTKPAAYPMYDRDLFGAAVIGQHTYTLTEGEHQECQTFAGMVDGTTCYGVRDGQTNEEKRKLDQYVGKAGEFAAWDRNGRKPDERPDTRIYEAAAKRFRPDTGSDWVKTSGKQWGDLPTWTFQTRANQDPQTLDMPHGKQRTVLVRQYGDRIFGVVAILPTAAVIELLKPTIKPFRNKMAIYWRDVPPGYRV